MNTLHNLWIIFLMGILGMWKAIPVGLLLQSNPLIIIVMTILGAFAGVLIIFFLGSRTKAWVLKKMNKKGFSKKGGKVNVIFEKYGIIGLGILGTLIVGPNMTMALGMVVVKSHLSTLNSQISKPE